MAPRNDLERSLEAIVRDVLGCGPVGVDDNFFALGGDSLRGTQVMARVAARHGVAIGVPMLFSHPTVATLAVAVEAARAAADAWARELAAEVGQMSEEEVARLLADEEAANRWSPR